MNETRRFELSVLATIERKSQWNASLAEACRRLQITKIEADCEHVAIELSRLAKHLGVSTIRTVPLSMKGRLVQEPGELVIEVNSELSEFERRFTVAHELAHLIVEGDELRAHNRLRRGKDPGAHSNKWTERLCDAVATEMLLPREWVKRCSADSSPRLDLVQRIARKAEATVDAVAERVLELGVWNCRFIWWVKKDGYFRAMKTIPFLDEVFLSFVAPGNQRRTLLRQASEQDIVEGQDVVRFRDETVAGICQCVIVEEKLILSLLVPSSRR